MGMMVAAFGAERSHVFGAPRVEHEKRAPSSAVHPYENWRHLADKDEFGRMPDQALNKAISQKQTLAARTPTSSFQWVEQGPSNLSGRACSLVISPISPLAMWMGAAGGGVWRSYDGGTTWFPVGDQLKSLSVNALALDPNDPNTLCK